MCLRPVGVNTGYACQRGLFATESSERFTSTALDYTPAKNWAGQGDSGSFSEPAVGQPLPDGEAQTERT